MSRHFLTMVLKPIWEMPHPLSQHWRKALLSLLTGLLMTTPAWSSPQIQILQVTDYQEEQQLLFDSQSLFRLPNTVIEAIHNEISLTFQTDIQFVEHHKVLGLDIERERLHIQYFTSLRYVSFSKEYILVNQRNNKVQSFKSLETALRTLGTLSAFPVLSLSELHPDQKYTLKLNIKLNPWRLPAPLVLHALLESEWQLDSGWFESVLYTPKSWL